MKFLDWNKDKWGSCQGSILEKDKLEHFLLAIFGTLLLLGFNFGALGVILMILLGVGWEIYNGLVPYDKINIQGFSYKDLIADIFGIITGILLFLIIQRFSSNFWIEMIPNYLILVIFLHKLIKKLVINNIFKDISKKNSVNKGRF